MYDAYFMFTTTDFKLGPFFHFFHVPLFVALTRGFLFTPLPVGERQQNIVGGEDGAYLQARNQAKTNKDARKKHNKSKRR
jgi:hypothetical protein